MPPPDPRSSTVWPGSNWRRAVGLPHPRDTATAFAGRPWGLCLRIEIGRDGIAAPAGRWAAAAILANRLGDRAVFLLDGRLNIDIGHDQLLIHACERM